MTQAIKIHEDDIAKIAQAVVLRLEPVIDEKMEALDARMAKIELAMAPVSGSTMHSINNHLGVGVEEMSRLADSYEKLTELLNLALSGHQAGIRLQRRMDEFQDKMRGRMSEVESAVDAVRDQVTRKGGALAPSAPRDDSEH